VPGLGTADRCKPAADLASDSLIVASASRWWYGWSLLEPCRRLRRPRLRLRQHCRGGLHVSQLWPPVFLALDSGASQLPPYLLLLSVFLLALKGWLCAITCPLVVRICRHSHPGSIGAEPTRLHVPEMAWHPAHASLYRRRSALTPFGSLPLHRLQGRRLPDARYSPGKCGIWCIVIALVYITAKKSGAGEMSLASWLLNGYVPPEVEPGLPMSMHRMSDSWSPLLLALQFAARNSLKSALEIREETLTSSSAAVLPQSHQCLFTTGSPSLCK
jgi:hypothetical protein